LEENAVLGSTNESQRHVLSQTCVLAGANGCWDWNVRTGGSSNTLLNLYNTY
jgi:hypothetical protein